MDKEYVMIRKDDFNELVGNTQVINSCINAFYASRCRNLKHAMTLLSDILRIEMRNKTILTSIRAGE